MIIQNPSNHHSPDTLKEDPQNEIISQNNLFQNFLKNEII